MKDLDAVVARVGDGDQGAVADGDAIGRRELPVAGAGRAERVGRRAVGIEQMHAVVTRVDGDEHAGQQGRRRGRRRAVALGMRDAASNDGGRGQQARDGDDAEQGEP